MAHSIPFSTLHIEPCPLSVGCPAVRVVCHLNVHPLDLKFRLIWSQADIHLLPVGPRPSNCAGNNGAQPGLTKYIFGLTRLITV